MKHISPGIQNQTAQILFEVLNWKGVRTVRVKKPRQIPALPLCLAHLPTRTPRKCLVWNNRKWPPCTTLKDRSCPSRIARSWVWKGSTVAKVTAARAHPSSPAFAHCVQTTTQHGNARDHLRICTKCTHITPTQKHKNWDEPPFKTDKQHTRPYW